MKKITIKKITLRNFLSFGNRDTVIELDNNLITQIVGQNNDVGSEGYSRNGAGKSTIFQAISFALFDTAITKIKKDDLINLSNKKDMFVKLELLIDDNFEITITRGRKPNIFEITHNGEPYTLHSVGSNDDAICELLGMNFDIFSNTVLYSTNTQPFLDLKASEQRDFMEQFLAMDKLTKRADKLKALAKDTKFELQLEEQKKLMHDENQERILENICQLDKKLAIWETGNQKELNELEELLIELKQVDIDVQKNLNNKKEQIAGIISNLEQEIIESSNSFKTNELNIKSLLNDELSKINDKKLKEITKIENDFNLIKQTLLNDKMESLEKISNERTEKMNGISTKRDEELEKISTRKLALSTIEKDIQKMSIELENIIEKINTLEVEQNSLSIGECPYCNQSYTSEEKKQHIYSELKDKTEEQDALTLSISNLLDKEETLKNEISSMEHKALSNFKKENEKMKEHFCKAEQHIKTEYDQNINEIDTSLNEELKNLNNLFSKNILDINEKYKNQLLSEEKIYKKNIEVVNSKIDEIKISVVEPMLSLVECEKITTQISHTEEQIVKLNKLENPYTDQLSNLRKDIKEFDQKLIKNLQKKEKHIKMLVKLLTDSKSFVRKSLLDQYIPFINNRIEYYLAKVESPHKVILNNDLTVDIGYLHDSISYGNLSNGEKLRANLSVSFAFRDFMELADKTMNLFLIDEALDNGIDSSGMRSVFKVLKEKTDKAVFLISHREDLLTEVDRIMTIEKNKGFSSVKFE